MKKTALLLAAAALLALAAPRARAFTYQGILQDASGNPLEPKNQLVEFRIYSAKTGGTPLWGCACTVLLDDKGIFNTEIADGEGSQLNGVNGTGLAAVLAANSTTTLWLGITVDGSSGEIAPRQALLPVPYANFALDASRASGDLAVAGRATAACADVAGQASAGSLDVSGAASIGGSLSVAGTVSGYGTAPVGCIVLWSGAEKDIPSGWALCNGQNGTPDLRNRFVVGAGSNYSVGATGGSADVTLTADQMPKHNHWYAGDDYLTDVGSYGGYNPANSKVATTYGYDASSSHSGNAAIFVTSDTGGNKAHENRPPFYALCYIMRIK